MTGLEVDETNCRLLGEVTRYPNLERIQKNKYVNYARENKAAYATNKPFPNILFENVFPENYLKLVAMEFPSPKLSSGLFGTEWYTWQNDQTLWKRQCLSEDCMGEATKHLISHLKSAVFVEFLEELTGIQNLIPDPKVSRV